MAGYEPHLQLVVSSGPFTGNEQRSLTEVVADQDFVANFDRANYVTKRLRTDAEGFCTFPALIPGATYRFLTYIERGNWEEFDFSVKPLETLQLPDVKLSQELLDDLASRK